MTGTKIEPTVPIDEFGLRSLSPDAALAWARTAGVEILTDYLGRAAVSLADAYKVGEYAQAAEAEAEAQRAASWARNQAKVAAQQDAMLASIGRGVAAPAGMENLSAATVMTAADKLERLDEAGSRFEEFAGGGLTYHPVSREGS